MCKACESTTEGQALVKELTAAREAFALAKPGANPAIAGFMARYNAQGVKRDGTPNGRPLQGADTRAMLVRIDTAERALRDHHNDYVKDAIAAQLLRNHSRA